MMPANFDALLGLPVNGALVHNLRGAALLVLGDQADALAVSLCATGQALVPGPHTIRFGLPVYASPTPLLVRALMTERNTTFESLALFGWIEDTFVTEPRAEVLGLTLSGEQPVMFLRDFDLDRPVEGYVRAARWLRLAGVAIASSEHHGLPQRPPAEEAALIALAHALPPDARPFAESLRLEHSRGAALKALLRARRKMTDPALMAQADGWRVLAAALPVLRVNTEHAAEVAALLSD